jgi:molecular chaperone DnaK (HSP70)
MTARTFLGIDIGTTFSCVAFADYSGGQIKPKLMRRLGEQGLIPSMVLYNNARDPVAFGLEALDAYLQNRSEQLFLVREFKMRLGSIITLQEGEQLFEIEAQEVYGAFLNYIRRQIEAHLDAELEGGRVCITYPADRGKVLGDRVIQATEDVFTGFEIVSMDEPSAVVQAVDHIDGFLTTKPTRILVVDSGGGTTDFALALAQYRWFSSKKPLAILKTSKIAVGGRDIDKAIYTEVENKIGAEITDRRDKEEILQLVRREKERYDWDGRDKLSVFTGRRTIELSGKDLQRVVQPSMAAIIEGIDTFMRVTSSEGPIQVIVLAGGNTRIPFLQEAIQSKFPSMLIQNVPFEQLQTAVARGAALYSHTSYEGIQYPLAYDIHIEYAGQKKQRLWKRGEMVPNPKKGPTDVLSGFRGIDSFKLILTNSDVRIEESVSLQFTPPLRLNTEVRIGFEVDANGYLRLTAEPLGNKDPDRQCRQVLRKYLFDTTLPQW